MAERIEQLHDETGEIDIMPRTKTEAITDGEGNELDTVLASKAQKATAVSGNVAKFDANGNPIDSGYTAEAIVTDHRNLLDNPFFTINQREVTSGTITASRYFVDRWISPIGNVTIDSNGVSFTTSTNDSGIRQRVEPDVIKVGKTYTYSILLQDGTIHKVTFTASTSNLVGQFSGTNISWEIDYSASSWTVWVYFQQSGGSIALRAVKLELGSISTLANDTAPDYATELLKCQRYYFNDKKSSGYSIGTYPAVVAGSPSSVVRFSIPVNMRAKPTITKNGSISYCGASSEVSVTSMNVVGYGNTFVEIDGTLSSAVTSIRGGTLAYGNASSYIELSADL